MCRKDGTAVSWIRSRSSSEQRSEKSSDSCSSGRGRGQTCLIPTPSNSLPRHESLHPVHATPCIPCTRCSFHGWCCCCVNEAAMAGRGGKGVSRGRKFFPSFPWYYSLFAGEDAPVFPCACAEVWGKSTPLRVDAILMNGMPEWVDPLLGEWPFNFPAPNMGIKWMQKYCMCGSFWLEIRDEVVRLIRSLPLIQY